MRFEITDLVRRILGDGWPGDLPSNENPVKDGSVVFDAFRLEAAHDAVGGHRVVLSFYGRDVMSSRIGEYHDGMTVTVAGFQGSMKLQLNEIS